MYLWQVLVNRPRLRPCEPCLLTRPVDDMDLVSLFAESPVAICPQPRGSGPSLLVPGINAHCTNLTTPSLRVVHQTILTC